MNNELVRPSAEKLAVKEQYSLFCEQHEVSIHGQPWWLDVVCGEHGWEVCLAFDKRGEVIAALPFVKSRKFFLKMIRMPILTSYLPISITYPEFEKQHNRLAFEKKVLADLINQLPEVALFDQNYHPDLSNWLPFYWKGFQQTTRYTYVLDNLSHLSEVHRHMEGSVRTYIRKAQKGGIQIIKGDDLKAFYKIVSLTFQKQNQQVPFDFEILKKLDEALNARNQRAIYFAKDPLGNIHAAGYIIWDKNSAYYLASGTNPEFRKSGAHYLLLWTAIKDCAKIVQSFDFEGSMLPQVENVFRSFGANQKPYFRIFKVNNPLLKTVNLLMSKY